MSGQFHAPANLRQGRSPLYTLCRRQGGDQIWSGRFGDEGDLLPLPVIARRFYGHTARSLVSIPTELHQLQSKGKSKAAKQAQRGGRCLALPILDPGARRVCVWSTPHPDRFIPWEKTQYLLYRRLGGPRGQSGRVQKISQHRVSSPEPYSLRQSKGVYA
jgi:hypothetical protein